MDAYNQQASDYIFRENNAVGRVDGDTIDLHGQFVEEVERILEQRIKYAQSTGQTHLHVYVCQSISRPLHSLVIEVWPSTRIDGQKYDKEC